MAQKVGNLLAENRSVLSLNDLLLDEIIDYKRSLYLRFEDEISESKQRGWHEISSTIQKPKNKTEDTSAAESNVKKIGLARTTFLKVAATLLICILLSVVFLQFDFNHPEIVAQAGPNQIIHTLNDNSRVQLRPHSTLSLLEESNDVVRYKLQGEAFFNVTKNRNRRFLIDAGPGVIEVTGTSFNIREWEGETTVFLQEGSLALNSSKTGKAVVLKPGEVATVSSDSNISEPVQSNGKEFISWQQDQIIFNNRTVASIIKELEYHYSINIQVPEQIENEVLGGTLSLESRAVSLENLGIVLGGNFSSIGDDTYQFVE